MESGEYGSAEEVFRRALEVLEAEETWTEQERSALDQKIDHALAQVSARNVLGRKKLAGNWPPCEKRISRTETS